jgi:hypothetical protein
VSALIQCDACAKAVEEHKAGMWWKVSRSLDASTFADPHRELHACSDECLEQLGHLRPSTAPPIPVEGNDDES